MSIGARWQATLFGSPSVHAGWYLRADVKSPFSAQDDQAGAVGLAALAIACLLQVACASASDDKSAEPTTSNTTDVTDVGTGPFHSEALATLVELLPADTSRAFAADLQALLASDHSDEVTQLLAGEGLDPALNETLKPSDTWP